MAMSRDFSDLAHQALLTGSGSSTAMEEDRAANKFQPRRFAACTWTRTKDNVRFQSIWEEISGSLGDLGTFVPIVIALTLVNGLDLGSTLLFTGAYNIITGLLFGVPMPVQPMKSIAAAALTVGDPLTIPQIMAAGIITAAVLTGLGITGLMTLVNRLVPLPVVRGIQLSQGISFGMTAVKYMLKDQDFAKGKTLGDRPWLGWDGKVLAIFALCFIIIVSGAGGVADRAAGTRAEQEEGLEEVGPSEGRNLGIGKRVNWVTSFVIPTAIIVFLLGVIIAFIRDPSIAKRLRVGPSTPHVVHITRRDWRIGFIRGAVPQIPLSILNSVIAVVKLSHDLFPAKNGVTPMTVSISVGLMNLVGCWFGGLPVCHGCGGLAGQYRFGARTGASVVFLGTAKLIIGLLLGSSLLQILSKYPISLLGVLLLFSGLELAMACRDQNTRIDSFVMLTVTMVSLTNNSAALGFCCGMAAFMLIIVRERWFWVLLWSYMPWANRPEEFPNAEYTAHNA